MALLFQLTQKLAQGFQAFWDRYPRREAKKDAIKAWGQVVNDDPVIEEQIQTALDWQVPHWETQEWYTPPLPATYLRQERFTDEKPTPKIATVNRTTVTPMVLEQMNASARIRSLVATGMEPEEAKRTVYLALGWIKE